MAGEASRENGKLGGRPKGYPALEAERARLIVTQKLATEFEPIVDKAIEQAKEGNKDAREYLSTFAYGKPAQPITGKDGKDLYPSNELIDKAKKAISKFIDTGNPQQ